MGRPTQGITGALDAEYPGLRTVDCSPAGKELRNKCISSFSLLLGTLHWPKTQMETRAKSKGETVPRCPAPEIKRQENLEAGPDVRFCIKESCVERNDDYMY